MDELSNEDKTIRRSNNLDRAVEVLKAAPDLLKPFVKGEDAGKHVVALAKELGKYLHEE